MTNVLLLIIVVILGLIYWRLYQAINSVVPSVLARTPLDALKTLVTPKKATIIFPKSRFEKEVERKTAENEARGFDTDLEDLVG